MKMLAEISDGSLGLSNQFEQLDTNYRLRKSARAILLNEAGEMALQHLRTYHFHKLPGGGVDPGESIEQALEREIREEVGCDCVILAPVGMTIEYRNEYQLQIISYCFVARVHGQIGTPQLEGGEMEEGQETLWLPPAAALTQMLEDIPGKKSGHFILKRETSFLSEFLNNPQAF